MSSPRIPRAGEAFEAARLLLRTVDDGHAAAGLSPSPSFEDLIDALESLSARRRYPADVQGRIRDLYQEWAGGGGGDRQHGFLVVIPVADRPRMMRACLEDLLGEQKAFRYGQGTGGGPSVGALIVEDGVDPRAREENRRLATEFSARGLSTRYWGLGEQEHVLSLLPSKLRSALTPLGAAARAEVGPHKGASATRNLALLVLAASRTILGPETLTWFVDSDEAWRVRVRGAASRDEDLRAFSYFHRLDRLFRGGGIDVATGHVVGDPPVSPAVMVRSFLEDLVVTLRSLQGLPATAPCPFHDRVTEEGHTAAYHDFAELFGYPSRRVPGTIACQVSGDHSLADGLAAYGAVLNGFFFGHHPTRATLHDPAQAPGATVPARTVYTGNVVVGPAARGIFVPFAHLGLRMAGPVLGRFLQKRCGARFVKANLPLLHSRVLGGADTGEHRAGLVRSGPVPDLGGEFHRQFWGDVLLFAVEELLAGSYPEEPASNEDVRIVVRDRFERLLDCYTERTEQLDPLIREMALAPPDGPRSGTFRDALARCRETVLRNFSREATAFARLRDPADSAPMCRSLEEAIIDFPRQEALWSDAIGLLGNGCLEAAVPLSPPR